MTVTSSRLGQHGLAVGFFGNETLTPDIKKKLGTKFLVWCEVAGLTTDGKIRGIYYPGN